MHVHIYALLTLCIIEDALSSARSLSLSPALPLSSLTALQENMQFAGRKEGRKEGKCIRFQNFAFRRRSLAPFCISQLDFPPGSHAARCTPKSAHNRKISPRTRRCNAQRRSNERIRPRRPIYLTLSAEDAIQHCLNDRSTELVDRRIHTLLPRTAIEECVWRTT